MINGSMQKNGHPSVNLRWWTLSWIWRITYWPPKGCKEIPHGWLAPHRRHGDNYHRKQICSIVEWRWSKFSTGIELLQFSKYHFKAYCWAPGSVYRFPLIIHITTDAEIICFKFFKRTNGRWAGLPRLVSYLLCCASSKIFFLRVL